jgi:hypothetical protein
MTLHNAACSITTPHALNPDCRAAFHELLPRAVNDLKSIATSVLEWTAWLRRQTPHSVATFLLGERLDECVDLLILTRNLGKFFRSDVP